MTIALHMRKLSTVVAMAACTALCTPASAQQPTTASSRRIPYKDPTLARVIGVVMPGGGQMYAERFGKAAGVFAGTGLCAGIAIDAGKNGNSPTEAIAIVA